MFFFLRVREASGQDDKDDTDVNTTASLGTASSLYRGGSPVFLGTGWDSYGPGWHLMASDGKGMIIWSTWCNMTNMAGSKWPDIYHRQLCWFVDLGQVLILRIPTSLLFRFAVKFQMFLTTFDCALPWGYEDEWYDMVIGSCLQGTSFYK